jgi:excisionase family DNA binding protein
MRNPRGSQCGSQLVASPGQTRRDPADHASPYRHLFVVNPDRGKLRKWVNRMTQTTQLSAVTPTPTGVIRAVEARLDGLERELAAARRALAEAEAELTASRARRDLEPDALTTDQVARVLGLSRSTINTLISRRDLRSVKIGAARRVLRRDLDAYLATLASGGAA